MSQSPSSRVLLLEDFESSRGAARWEGPIDVQTNHASHGSRSGRIRLDRDHREISSSKLASDWRGYDRLLFDIYSESDQVSLATIRIYDAVGGDAQAAPRNEYFDGHRKILLVKGWNHVEVKLNPLKAATFLRDMSLDQIRQFVLTFEPNASFTTMSLDNLRLVSGDEGPDTISRQQPQDGVSLIDNRWVTARQVARPDGVPESPEVTRIRTDAERELDSLKKTIEAARAQGIETIYAERRLVTADLGLRVRPLLPWFNNDVKKGEMFAWVAESCRESRHHLEDLLQGVTMRAEEDDTQAGAPLIRPYPRLKGLTSKGWFFRDEAGDPLMILSVHSPSQMLQRFFASPLQHIESYSVGGGSRWTIDQSPVYAVFKQDPDSHRVGWDGWCGHLVRDLDSMGGTKKENVVICLESPRIREAISEYIRTTIPTMHHNPELLYDIMAYELTYICYCERSQRAFRQWLKTTHGTIDSANRDWQTTYGSFEDVTAPAVKNQKPLPATNRGLWYDWTRFNQDRFTDYLLWVRDQIRKIDATMPLAAGGSSSMLAGHTGTSGIDEERIVNEVDDVIIHEGGGSTLGMDLQMAFANERKPLADPEMSLGEVEHLLPHFLHGKSVAQLYHWPAQPANEFYSNNQSSLAHSWNFPLADVDEVLRVALDVRRLNKEIAAFVDTPAEIAILYSQTSTLQLPAEMLTWRTTPYLSELQKTYAASQVLDAKVTFVTERQILKGKLDAYKLLLIPGARNVPPAVVESIRAYVARGGHVLIVPESLLGDEYNRRQPYLAQFGVTVRGTERPRVTESERMVQGYDQSFAQDVAFRGGASEKLTAAGNAFDGVGDLETAGIRQTIEPVTGINTVFRYPDGTPAIVQARIGRGLATYAASSLESAGYARFLDALASAAGVSRRVRVRAVDHIAGTGLEARFARLGERQLIYIFNIGAQPVRVRVERADAPVTSISELRESRTTRGNEVIVPAHQTNLYELFSSKYQSYRRGATLSWQVRSGARYNNGTNMGSR